MKNVVSELEYLVHTFSAQSAAMNESVLAAKENPGKWSKQEVIGHLIDSAENNLRRFICAQYESQPPRIRYDQNFWVNANGYATAPAREVIENWKLINLKICRVLSNMPSENYQKTCDTGRDTPQLHTIEWLAIDYVKHLKHHLNQIIPNSFDIIYDSR
ncbi:MAG: DinB family protein [Cyclobacteriaceae bacterium]|jgi:hypothetical protein